MTAFAAARCAMDAAKAGLLYFAFCFTAGAVLAPICLAAFEPSRCATAAVAVESPIMLAVMVLAARAVLSRHRCTPDSRLV